MIRKSRAQAMPSSPSAQGSGTSSSLLLPNQQQIMQIIQDTLEGYGMDEQTAKFWVAVSAFETAGWTSQVFADSNNLFDIRHWPGSKLPYLSYGEGQVIFDSYQAAADGLIKYVLTPFSYHKNELTLQNLTDEMKQNGYYESDSTTYFVDVSQWYTKLYGS